MADIFDQFRSDGTSAPKVTGKPADGGDIFQQFRAADGATKTAPPATTPQEQPPESDAPAWMWQRPTMPATALPGPAVPSADQQSVDTGLPLPRSPPPGGLVDTSLQPGPNVATLMPLSRDANGNMRFALPNALRDILTGNLGPETTADPDTGKIQYGMTPGANLLLSAGARPLAFSGGHPLMPVPGGTFTGPVPTTAAELTAAVQRAGETTPRMAAELEARLRANALPPDAHPATPTAPSGGWRPVQPGEVFQTGGNFRMNQTTGVAEVYEPPAAPQPAATAQPTAAGPQPTGAQVTPTSAAQMTPEQIATQRTVADKQWLNQTQQPGVQDTTVHVPGITPNLVEQEQTVTAARELKALKNLNPELSQAEREILDHNTDLRKGFYADTAGSDVTRAADLKAANDKINTDLAQVWQGKRQADPTNVRAQIDTELAGSAGDLPPLKSAMKQVGDSLENAGTDPQAMYRTHRLINYLQSRQGQLENPGYGAADVQAALTRTKGVLAQTIDDAAPGFGNVMSDYSNARGPIDAAKALQDRENGLYDSRGNMSFLKVHGLMRDIIDAQKWDAPNDPLAGVSDAQMTRLKALHDDLKRVASAKDLATAQGSDTAMNAVDIAKAYGKLATRAGVEGAANLAFGPGVGSMIVRGAENLLRPITSGIAARGQIRRGMEILQPPPSNPLQPP